MRTKPHSHPCQRCQLKTECGGVLSDVTGIPVKERCHRCTVRWQQVNGYCCTCWRIEARRRRIANGTPAKAHDVRRQAYFPPAGMVARSLLWNVIGPR